MALYEFQKDDVLYNTVKAHPFNEFFIHNSVVLYENSPGFLKRSSVPLGSIQDTDYLSNLHRGSVTIFNINSTRTETNTGRVIGPSSSVNPETNVLDNGTIYPFIQAKDGSGLSFKTITEQQYALLEAGSIITGSYYISSSIKRYFLSSSYTTNLNNNNITSINNYTTTNPNSPRDFVLQDLKPLITGSIIESLKTYIESYKIYSSAFDFESGVNGSSYKQSNVNFIKIPSLFFGSEMKKGTVQLDYYITGTLVATAKDTRQNGELVQTYCLQTPTSTGSIIGTVLYNHGCLLLFDTGTLSAVQADYNADTALENTSWIYWGSGCNDGINASSYPTIQSASFGLSFKGTNYIPNLTMFATAKKGELNWSNNPTFLSGTSEYPLFKVSPMQIVQSSSYVQNIVSSSIPTYSSSYSKTTYINQVNLYDDMGNLIGIAKTSKPIKKTEDTDFTFKLKLDM